MFNAFGFFHSHPYFNYIYFEKRYTQNSGICFLKTNIFSLLNDGLLQVRNNSKLIHSIHLSNNELAMQSLLTFGAEIFALSTIIFEKVHNYTTGFAKSSLRPQHF